MKILESASKIVFILMALALVGLTFMKIVEAKDFMMLTGMAFTFYFSNKGSKEDNYLNK
jgi:uncharacterized membrane protein